MRRNWTDGVIAIGPSFFELVADIWMETNMKRAFAIVVPFVALFTLTSIAPERAAAAASPGLQRESYCMSLSRGPLPARR